MKGNHTCRLGAVITVVLLSCAGEDATPADGPAAEGAATPATEEGEPTTVRVVPIGREDIADVLQYVADLEPITQVKIFSPVPDRILDFPWQDGQEIRRGQRIALIRKEGIDHGLEQVIAQGEALEAQLKNLEAERDRSAELLRRGVISQQMFDRVETQYKATLAQHKAIEASKDQLAVNARNAVITSPFDGVIAGKMLERGDMAIPQVPLCRVMAVHRLKAVLKLVEADVGKVFLGQTAQIHLDAYPDRQFEGKVTSIMPYIDPKTRTNAVEVTLDNPRQEENGNRLLKPGMFGRAELIVALHEQVLAAPEPALLMDDQTLQKQQKGEMVRKAFVVDEGGVARAHLVTLGPRKGALFEVKDGLSEGDRVVIRGQHQLKDGDSVKIIAAQD